MSPKDHATPSLLLLVAGIKGAIGSTLATAVCALRDRPDMVLPSLTTAEKFHHIGPVNKVYLAGWDCTPRSLPAAVVHHGVLPPHLREAYETALAEVPVRPAPHPEQPLSAQIGQLQADIQAFTGAFRHCRPVFIDLLPAAPPLDLTHVSRTEQLSDTVSPDFPDLAYALAAIQLGIPVVNFTPNAVEQPIVVEEADRRGVPISGRDGKTGQTYLKVVLASALKARSLWIDGWYSLNLLGNDDGKNLQDPCRAAEKLQNKTAVLDAVLGYPQGAHRLLSTPRRCQGGLGSDRPARPFRTAHEHPHQLARQGLDPRRAPRFGSQPLDGGPAGSRLPGCRFRAGIFL
jgi:myo-inositol-1-phosphate synthase